MPEKRRGIGQALGGGEPSAGKLAEEQRDADHILGREREAGESESASREAAWSGRWLHQLPILGK